MAREHSCSFLPEERLHNDQDFLRLRKSREKVHGRMFTYVRCPNALGQARLGLIVTRKTGNAVVRNRWKRILRDFFRTHKGSFKTSTDHLWIVKPSCKGRPPMKIREEIQFLLQKMK